MSRSGAPDLVLVMTDQQRFDQVGYAGCLASTPNLDALAADGVIFENAYSASTTCVPARTSLMTGLFDHRTPRSSPPWLDEGSWTVAHALRAAGYQTALIGKMHAQPMRADHGFDHLRVCEHVNAYDEVSAAHAGVDHYHDWLSERGLADWRFEASVPGVYDLDPDTHPTSWVRDQTLQFLAERDRTRPMFLVVSFPHPHPPINPPEPYASMYDPADCWVDPDGASANQYLPNSFRQRTIQADHPERRIDPRHLARHRSSLARTYGLITQVDDAVGTIVSQIDLPSTMLWFTSDHGDYAGRRGLVRKVPWIPFDDLAKVPCFATGGPVIGGRREPAPMQSFDFAVTALAAARLDLDFDLEVFDGIDVGPMLTDPNRALAPDRLVYSAITMKLPMVRRGGHKYIRDCGWGSEVLFDVGRDPDEVWNVMSLDTDRVITDELAAAVDRQLVASSPTLPSFGRDVGSRGGHRSARP